MSGMGLSHVGKVYQDGTRAVTDLNLDIRDGELLVLVGPSGCGKTTALRMVAGLEDISEGTVEIGGRVVNKTPSRDRDVAMVFQSYALYPHLSVRDNIGFGLRLRKLPKSQIKSRVDEAARVLGLTEHLDRKPRNLSGGQRQRVAMGRAIVREPQAFLMDEPLSNLDAKLRVQMRAEIARIQRDLNVTTLYVTHDQTEAMTLGDRVAVMRQGVLQQVAPPQELYDHPTNMFVAGFIGSPAMNLMMGRLGEIPEDDGPFDLELGSQRLRVPGTVLVNRPRLREYAGALVAVGIRPEDMEDAALSDQEASRPDASGQASDGHTLSARADLVEAMGSDVMVHLALDASPVVTEDTLHLARSIGTAEPADESTTTIAVGRFDPATTATEGQPVRVVVNTARLHFFDPETGQALWGVDDESSQENQPGKGT